MDTTEHNCDGAGGQLDYWSETVSCADCGAERAATKDELDDYRAMMDEDFKKSIMENYMRDLRDTQDAMES